MMPRYLDSLELVILTIYDHPRDYPDDFVVRRWVGRGLNEPVPDRDPYARVETLEEARALVPKDYSHTPRVAEDDPKIVESWISTIRVTSEIPDPVAQCGPAGA